MSDLAPLFTTGVAEVLRSKAIEDLTKENTALKNENEDLKTKTHIVVSRLISTEEPWEEWVEVAEGILEDMVTLQKDDIPVHISFLLDDTVDNLYYAVKLRNTAAWVGNFDDLSGIFMVRLKQGKSSTTLGIYSGGRISRRLNQHHGTLRSELKFLQTNLTPVTVELEQTFCLDTLALSIVSHDSHAYWNTYESVNNEYSRGAEHQFIHNAPANSAKGVFEYLFFRPAGFDLI